MSKILIP